MYHYIYMIQSQSGKFYVGRHSSETLDDGYMGSGKWVRQLKDKSGLTKTILEFCDTFDDLLEREREVIASNINHPDCMNFNNSPVGFGTKDYNPARDPAELQRRAERMRGDNNPAKRPDVRLKKSQAMAGRPAHNKGKARTEEERLAISRGRTGIKYSEEGRRKLSESRKRQFELGDRRLPNNKGRIMSQSQKQQLSESALARERATCPHCGKVCDKGNYSRWHGNNCKMKE